MMNVASTGRVDHDKDGWDCYTNERLLFAESWGHRRVGQPQLWRLGCVTGEVANFCTRNLNRRGNDRGKWRKTIPEAKTRPGLSSLLLLLLLLMTFMQCIHNYVRETNHVSRVQFCDYPVFKVYTTCNVISHVKYSVLVFAQPYCLQCVYFASCGCFLQLLEVALSRYVAQVFSDRPWDDPSHLYWN